MVQCLAGELQEQHFVHRAEPVQVVEKRKEHDDDDQQRPHDRNELTRRDTRHGNRSINQSINQPVNQPTEAAVFSVSAHAPWQHRRGSSQTRLRREGHPSASQRSSPPRPQTSPSQSGPASSRSSRPCPTTIITTSGSATVDTTAQQHNSTTCMDSVGFLEKYSVTL